MSVLHAPEHDGNQVAGLDVVSALVEVFGGLVDPRLPRGIRYGLASVLTIAVLAVLAGGRNFREVGDRASELPTELLVAAGARASPRTGRPTAPAFSWYVPFWCYRLKSVRTRS